MMHECLNYENPIHINYISGLWWRIHEQQQIGLKQCTQHVPGLKIQVERKENNTYNPTPIWTVTKESIRIYLQGSSQLEDISGSDKQGSSFSEFYQ